jgi:CheY-like chemotaxis protein
MRGTLNKILSVEDDPDIRAVIRLALEEVGNYTVEVCHSGADALEVAPIFRPDLILLDAMMPDMDGQETLQALRNIPEIKETPVVFMTAKVMSGEIKKFRELSANDVIAKPFDPLTLSDRIQEIWEQPHGQDDS